MNRDPHSVMGLDEVAFTAAGIAHPDRRRTAPEEALAGYLEEARRVLAGAGPAAQVVASDLGTDFEKLRWFPLPDEMQRELLATQLTADS